MNAAQATTHPLVTVIMAVYNGESYLSAAIESALQQSYANLEMIIVDDCSSDESISIIEKYLSDRRVRFVQNNQNSGVAASRNRALALSRGELITFLDQDDIWLPHKLEYQVTAIHSHPQVGLLHARYARIDTSGELLPPWKQLPTDSFDNPDAQVEVRDVFAEIFVSNDIQPLTTMIPRKIFEEVGTFDPNLPGVDDYELWLRIALRYPVGQLHTIVGYWRAHPGQQSNQGYKMLMIRLAALDSVLARFPEARERVPSRSFRIRMHGMCRSAANYKMYYLHDYQAARELYGKALTYHPADIVSLMKYAYCSLPARSRNAVKRAKNALSRKNPTSSE